MLLSIDKHEDPCRFEPGDRCGPYRILRFIGRGAAGEAYEAEDIDTGRRLALKILNRRLRRTLDRERFLSEGRAAAAIVHPNVVFVFEAAEVAGLPVLAMELVAGETLAGHVARLGPLPAAVAVDLILQVIDGLEAMAARGLLHGDITPSNCFVTADQRAKIGDFGLAGAPTVRGSGKSPARLGFTPEFAAPEQIAGDGEVDSRADMYSVGATLFFLLTGCPPILHGNRDRIHHRDILRTVVWPRSSEIPAVLRRAVNRCLSIRRSGRFATYADLKDALTPCASHSAESATLGPMASALALDLVMLLPMTGPMAAIALATRWVRSPSQLALLISACLALYTGASCGIRGATIGMRRCGLVLRSQAGMTPVAAILLSTLLLVPAIVWVSAERLVGRAHPLNPLAPVGAMLSTALLVAMPRTNRLVRRKLSGTGVELVRVGDCRNSLPAQGPAIGTAGAGALSMGPYEIRGARAEAADGVVWDAWDPVLHRRVWLYQRRAGAPPLVDTAQRANRVTRLRWLQGCRSEAVAWDGFEALDGGPLSARRDGVWPDVAAWAADLAAELEARRLEGDPPRLDDERVWITASGRAVLLDIPVSQTRDPGVAAATAAEPDGGAAAVLTPQPWLARIARTALGARHVPLPVTAHACLDRLARSGFENLADAAATLRTLSATPDRVTSEARVNTLILSALALALAVALARAGLAALPAGAPAFLRTPTPLPFVALLCGAAAVLSSVFTTGGVWLSANRIVVVAAGGTPASRGRRAARALLAWSWLLVPALMHRPVLPRQLIVLMPLALWHAVRNPSEGLVDYLCGTRLVPQ
jgi:hypothetical protein